MKQSCWIALLLGVIACSNDPIAVEDNKLGIASVIVEHGAAGLEIRGLDQSEFEIARLTLRVGTVEWAPDLGEPTQPVSGRSLIVHVNGEPEFDHTSPGTLPLNLPAPTSARTDAFLQLTIVQETLRSEGIAIRSADSDVLGEIPFAWTMPGPCLTCAYTPNPSCQPADCGANVLRNGEEQLVCCFGTSLAAQRTCTGTGYSECGPEGPAGCATCWATSFTSCEIYTDPGWNQCTLVY